jgi:hypothetical protein
MNAPLVKVPIRFSHLKQMAQSPAHVLDAMADAVDETLSMRIGSGAHAILLGKPWAVYSGIRRGKAWDEFQAANEGSCLLNEAEYDHASRMVDAIRSHSRARELLAGLELETTLDGEYLGRKTSGTPDAFGAEFVVELKSTRCANPERFVRDGTWRHYHAQLAWYRELIGCARGTRPERAFIVAVENRRPYCVTVFELTRAALERGERSCRLWMERLLVCESEGRWPGYIETDAVFDVEDDDAARINIDGEEVEF